MDKVFQRIGRTVAVTGDGANDALRRPDGGRPGRHRRSAGDVLAALVQGRAVWASVRRPVTVLVGGGPRRDRSRRPRRHLTSNSPLRAHQLLLVNLFTDPAPAIAIALRPHGGADRPRTPGVSRFLGRTPPGPAG